MKSLFIVAALFCAVGAQDAAVNLPAIVPARDLGINHTDHTSNAGAGKRGYFKPKRALVLTSCSYKVKELPRNLPLLMNGDGKIARPSKIGQLSLKQGETLRLVCPGKGNTLRSMNVTETLVRCPKSNDRRPHSSRRVSLRNLECSKGRVKPILPPPAAPNKPLLV